MRWHLELTTSCSSLEMGIQGRNGPDTKSRVSRVNGGIVQISGTRSDQRKKKIPGVESAPVNPQESRIIF